MKKWMDISQPLTNELAHWPEDAPFSYSLTYTKEQIGSANIGQMTASLHSGTHVDAPFHFDNDGITIDEIDINLYVGKAYVLDVSHTDTITKESIENIPPVERLLLRTSLRNNPNRFPSKIPNLDLEIVPLLKEKGVRLLGVDMPSVDAIDSKTLPIHHALYNNDIYILENLMLDKVSQGVYELIALPLNIVGADGSPVRAVLRPL